MIRGLWLRLGDVWQSLPLAAKVVQGLAVALFLWGSTCGSGTELGPPVPEGRGDAALYRAILERIRHGEEYYKVTAEELHTRRYATIPSLNWRLPTLAAFLAILPSDDFGARVLFVLGTGTAVLWCFYLVRIKHDMLSLFCLPLLLSMMPAWRGGALVHELWSGELVSLSLVLRLLRFVTPSVLAGAAALSIRELALPYAVAMAIAAWHEGKGREAVAWATVVVVFGAAMAVHLTIAGSLAPPDALTNSWLVAGGWCQVLKTSRTNPLLTLLPTPWLAGAVSFAWAGLWAWRSPGMVRVAWVVSVYLAAFAVIGRPDNFYWGLMIAPLLLLGPVGWIIALGRGGGGGDRWAQS